MSPEAQQLLGELRLGWEVYTVDGAIYYVVARNTNAAVLKELHEAGELEAISGFPGGRYYRAKKPLVTPATGVVKEK